MSEGKHNGKVISFINMKGGVGKTTLTKEIGFRLANSLNYKVLLIDIDPQINLTQSIFKRFGFAQSKDLANKSNIEENSDNNLKITEASIQNVLEGNISLSNPTDLDKAIFNIPNTNLSIIPGEFGLEFLTRNLNSSNLENGIYNFIDDNNLKDQFDYILIDCPPTYSSYTIAALKPSNYYVVPVKPEAYSMLGVDMLEKVVDETKKTNKVYFKDKDLKNLGIIITNVKAKEKEKPGILNLINDIENSRILKENGIRVFKNHFLHNSSLQSDMSYLIDTSNAEKYSKPNLVKLTEEFVSYTREDTK
ncbi:ParA family protein [Limosilactobacillus fermentum]|uniref:ParA family protein n=1 Tax=Limosilactobacillus fermentum TaxID=1613 RepID=UPI0021A8DFA8|nr:AAA family ATPase [Limosilactobacillus fermentum]MCT2869756.1 ParA family protein [Limosilactobacillus fermentum]